jgi:hypothetical protein
MKNSITCLAAGLFICAGSSLNLSAAEPSAASAEPAKPVNSTAVETTAVKDDSDRFYRPWTVGVEGGSTGLGVFGSWRFSNLLGVRAGADYLEISQNDDEIRGIHYNDKLRLLSAPITLDVYPWKTHSFHVSLGLMINENQLSGSANYYNTIVINGQTFTRASVGSLDMKISQQPVNPYLSIGGNFFYFDHPHQWALGGELGVAYTGDATATLTRTGPPSAAVDTAVAAAQRGLQHYADQFKWWPVLKIFVSYSF